MGYLIRAGSASRPHYILNHASAARCKYECKCNKYLGLKYPLTEKVREKLSNMCCVVWQRGDIGRTVRQWREIRYQVSPGVFI